MVYANSIIELYQHKCRRNHAGRNLSAFWLGLPLLIKAQGFHCLDPLTIYIYTLYLYITPGCIQYRECTQAEPTRQEHLVRANRPTQAEPTLRLRPSRTLPTECYNFRTRLAVASSYIEVAITPDQQLQSYFFNKISQSYSVLVITSEQLNSCIHTMLQFSNKTSSCI
jgi:hypothetical protein